jgi:hypothetical protein
MIHTYHVTSFQYGEGSGGVITIEAVLNRKLME